MANFTIWLVLCCTFFVAGVVVLGDPYHETIIGYSQFHKEWQVFRVQDNNTILVPNGNRNGCELKLSLGSSILKIEARTPTLWQLKLADQSLVQLSVVDEQKGSTALDLKWFGGGPNGLNREICFHYGSSTWYDTYQQKYAPTWPMNLTVSDQSRIAFNYLLDQTSDNPVFNVQELLFLNSDGFAILLDQDQALFMQRRGSQPGSICFSVDSKPPYNERVHVPSNYDIKVHLYASANIRSVLDYVHRVSPHIPKPSRPPPEETFSRVSWDTTSEYPLNLPMNTKADYIGYTARLIEAGFRHGEVVREHGSPSAIPTDVDLDVLGYSNVSRVGDFVFQHIVRPQIVPVTKAILPDRLHNFIRGVTPHFGYYATYNADFSNPIAVGWYSRLYRELLLDYDGQIHSYFLEPFFSILHTIDITDPQYRSSPNRLITKYVQTVAQFPELKDASVTTRVAYKVQHLPVMVQLRTDEFVSGYRKVDHTLSSGEYLQVLIAQGMAASIAGYSYFATNPIGTPSKGLTEELYIRWVQATTFMPHMTFYRTPWHFSPACVNITRNYVQLHSKYVPLMVRLADERVRTGAPLVRPMWYAEPDNRQVHGIVDQFMVGDQLVVAPVLKEGQRARKVYLPQGVWLDQHGKHFTGPGEVTVEAPLQELPFFRAMQKSLLSP